MCYVNDGPNNDKRFTKENVYQAIKKANIMYPDVVFAQIMLESGNLKSDLTKKNNNFLGMKMPSKRETTAVGELHGYAQYFDWEGCVNDYALYQNYVLRKKTMSRNQYIAFIGKKYSQCGAYKSRIMRVIKENRNFVKTQDSVYYCSTM